MQIGCCPSSLNVIGGYAQTIQCKTASWTLSQASTCRAASRRRDDWARQEIRASCSQPAEMKQARPGSPVVLWPWSVKGCMPSPLHESFSRARCRDAGIFRNRKCLAGAPKTPRNDSREVPEVAQACPAAGIRLNKGELHENRAFADGTPPRHFTFRPNP